MKNAIFNKNRNLRDYDKNPITLYNYEVFYDGCITAIPLLSALAIPLSIKALFDNEALSDIVLGNILAFGIVAFMVIVFLIFDNPKKSKILIKNSIVEFYEINSNELKLRRMVELTNLNETICKPLFGYSKKKDTKAILICILIFGFAACIAISFSFFIECLIFGFLGLLLANFILCIIVGKNGDRFFTIFPRIAVASPYMMSYGGGNLTPPQYYSLIIYNRSKYEEVKEYFLNLHNINIDNIEKNYF